MKKLYTFCTLLGITFFTFFNIAFASISPTQGNNLNGTDEFYILCQNNNNLWIVFLPNNTLFSSGSCADGGTTPYTLNSLGGNPPYNTGYYTFVECDPVIDSLNGFSCANAETLTIALNTPAYISTIGIFNLNSNSAVLGVASVNSMFSNYSQGIGETLAFGLGKILLILASLIGLSIIIYYFLKFIGGKKKVKNDWAGKITKDWATFRHRQNRENMRHGKHIGLPF